MGEKRRTMEQIRDIVESEGLGYAVQSYIGHESVPLELADAWKRASDALDEIEKALELDE